MTVDPGAPRRAARRRRRAQGAGRDVRERRSLLRGVRAEREDPGASAPATSTVSTSRASSVSPWARTKPRSSSSISASRPSPASSARAWCAASRACALDQRDGAMEDWRAGLEAAGGKHEGLERLISMAESGATAEEILGSPPHVASAAGSDAAHPPADPQPARAAASSGAYRVRVELAPGTVRASRRRPLRQPQDRRRRRSALRREAHRLPHLPARPHARLQRRDARSRGPSASRPKGVVSARLDSRRQRLDARARPALSPTPRSTAADADATLTCATSRPHVREARRAP